MLQVERDAADKASTRRMKRILSPIFTVFQDYQRVVDTLASADPMPTALIWGALRIVVEGMGRYVRLFDTIKDELAQLSDLVERLGLQEELYGKSKNMQELLCRTYINILKFWHRVDKECARCNWNLLIRASASFSKAKLQTILDQIEHDADAVDKLASLVEGRLARGEREDAEKERLAAGIEREESRIERQQQLEWRHEQKMALPGLLFLQLFRTPLLKCAHRTALSYH